MPPSRSTWRRDRCRERWRLPPAGRLEHRRPRSQLPPWDGGLPPSMGRGSSCSAHKQEQPRRRSGEPRPPPGLQQHVSPLFSPSRTVFFLPPPLPGSSLHRKRGSISRQPVVHGSVFAPPGCSDLRRRWHPKWDRAGYSGIRLKHADDALRAIHGARSSSAHASRGRHP
jgi:hypothetical protein